MPTVPDRRLTPRAPVSTGDLGRHGGARTPRASSQHLATPFTEAVSTLNDRALRRLLGARAFLRGYDYGGPPAGDTVVSGAGAARGAVRGTDPEPYQVEIQLS